MLDEILSEFEEITGIQKTDPIPKERVMLWMQSDNIQVLGAACYLILDSRYYSRIEPPLTLSDYHKFMIKYYTRCIRENPSIEWAATRYEAGWAIVNWFVHLWDDSSAPRKIILELKNRIAKLYKEGDEQIRKCIITATLEHLFENKKIAKYFNDWCNDSVLSTAYNEALVYSKQVKSKK